MGIGDRAAGMMAPPNRFKRNKGPKQNWHLWFSPRMPDHVTEMSWVIRPVPIDPDKNPDGLVTKIFHNTPFDVEQKGFKGAMEMKKLRIVCPETLGQSCPFCNAFDVIDLELFELQEAGGAPTQGQLDKWDALEPIKHNVLPIVFPTKAPDASLYNIEVAGVKLQEVDCSEPWIWSISQESIMSALIHILKLVPDLFDPEQGRDLILYRSNNKYRLEARGDCTPFPTNVDLNKVPNLKGWGKNSIFKPDAVKVYFDRTLDWINERNKSSVKRDDLDLEIDLAPGELNNIIGGR